MSGSTAPVYNYLITVIRYTDDGSDHAPNLIADRCVDTVYFGDGSHDWAERSNGTTPLCIGCPPCGCRTYHSARASRLSVETSTLLKDM